MSGLSKYLISVVVSALICGILTGLVDKKNKQYPLIRLLGGILLSLTVIKPLANIQIDDIALYSRSLSLDAQHAVSYGEALAAEQKNEIIKKKLETYILDKAASLGASLEVSVTLSTEGSCLPEKVTLSGDAAPLCKARLTKIIAEDLGIAEEDQTWIS